MKIISCENCGGVIDIDRIDEPIIYNDDGTINEERAIYIKRDFHPAIICPLCKSKIAYDSGNVN